MKTFARLTAMLGAAMMLAVAIPSASFAQAPAPGKKAVKGYTRKTKSGKVITVKGYTKTMGKKTMGKKTMTTKTTTVKGYTKTLKSGKKVAVKGYTRKVTKKTMMPKKP